MKISIVTPTFNSAKTILDTCKSITSQTYQNFEHIIIDNLSTDGTLELIKNHYKDKNLEDKLFVFSEKDFGISDAFNRGITKATGKIIAILNSDDYYLERDLFQNVIDVFNLGPNINIFHGDIYFEDDVFGSSTRRPLLCDIEFGMPLNHPTCFVKKSLYNSIGIFNLEFKYAMDFEWLARFYSKEKSSLFYYNSKTITFMRGSGASASFEIKTINEIKKALILHNLWNKKAESDFSKRILRANLKSAMLKFNLVWPVKLWRSLKWRSFP
jgi:glycosyltransferase